MALNIQIPLIFSYRCKCHGMVLCTVLRRISKHIYTFRNFLHDSYKHGNLPFPQSHNSFTNDSTFANILPRVYDIINNKFIKDVR